MLHLRFVQNGNSIRGVGRKCGIPESSIRKALLKALNEGLVSKDPRFGRCFVFPQNEEEELRKHALTLGRLFYGSSPVQVCKLAFSFAEGNDIKHSFNEDRKMAGKDWYLLQIFKTES